MCTVFTELTGHSLCHYMPDWSCCELHGGAHMGHMVHTVLCRDGVFAFQNVGSTVDVTQTLLYIQKSAGVMPIMAWELLKRSLQNSQPFMSEQGTAFNTSTILLQQLLVLSAELRTHAAGALPGCGERVQQCQEC